MNLPITVGMRVNTPLGLATVLGFERFLKGDHSDLVWHDNGGRICVQLDHPENWYFSRTGIYPYMYRRDLTSFNPEITT